MNIIAGEPLYVVYALYCTCHEDRGLRYVGQTTRGASVRFRFHIWDAISDRSDLAVHRWVRKHGGDNIRYVILEALESPERLDEIEIKWIRKLGTFSDPRGLNMSEGGKSIKGYVHSEETRKKMCGRVYTDETRTKMSNSAKLRGISPLAVQMARERVGSKHPNTFLTEEGVSQIKERLWSGTPVRVVANDRGLLISLVSHINTGVTWSHVDWPIGPRQAPRTRALMSASAKGRIHTPEAIEKMRVGQRASWTPERLAKAQAVGLGEGNPAAKLNEELVRAIRLRHDEGESYVSISRTLGVSDGAIAKVCKRITWKHVI